MCGGGPPPAPPPNYTAEKAQFAADTLAGYQTEADKYNTGVDAFNSNLDLYNTDLGSAETALAGANIYDLYDDPDTEANEDVLAGYSNRLNNFDFDSLSNTDFGDAPIFSPVVESPYGPVTISGIPELSTANTTLADDLYDRGMNLSTGIDSLYGERSTALDAYMGEASALEAEASKLGYALDRASIGSDLTGFNNQLTDLDLESQDILNSRFYDQTRFGDGNGASFIDSKRAELANLEAARANELSRISTYETTLDNRANAYATELGGLGITDMGRLDQIDQEIAKIKREAGQFNSELGYDFSDELGGFSSASNAMSGIRADYDTEMDRVNAYEEKTRDDIRALRDSAFSTNMYSMGGLDALDNSLADFKQDAGFFSSDLVPEGRFEGLLQPYYDTISERSADLRSNRSDALDALTARINGVTGGLGDIQLYNEDAFYDASSRLSDIGSDLGMFSGGRVDGIASDIGTGQRKVDNKIRELQAYRSKLEEDMIAYLEQIKTNDYYNFDDVAAAREGVAGKESDVRLYRAKQAMDEITDMIAALDGQDRRLKADAAAAAARQASAQGGVGFGGSAFANQNYTPMTSSQYTAFLNSGSEEDPRYTSNPSAFSSNLGVIKI